jgi:CDP-diacylglycerol--glycerol-3-phosphate 3-phosphatidyltransferase
LPSAVFDLEYDTRRLKNSGMTIVGEASDMSTTLSNAPRSVVWNVPNTLSFLRLGLALAVMFLIPAEWYWAALVVFSVAASTDWVDGYWARRYGQVTKLGRVLDPFVDKVIICATWIALVAVPESGITGWMATVVVIRELAVTSLRSMVEGQGGDFSARPLGKWKMAAQCAAVVLVLWSLAIGDSTPWLGWLKLPMIWLAIILTIASGIDYVLIAARGLVTTTST